MDRRYYRLKAFVVALGIGAAVFSSTFGVPRLSGPMTHLHYGAAASVETVVAQSTVKASRAIADFVRQHDCVSLPRL